MDKLQQEFCNLTKSIKAMHYSMETLFTILIKSCFAEDDDVEMKFVSNGRIKIISNKCLSQTRLATLNMTFPLYQLSWNEYMTCVIYTLNPKEEKYNE